MSACSIFKPPTEISWKLPLSDFLGSGRFTVRSCDVRDPKSLRKSAVDSNVIVNLAAVHREPGHRPEEYFETNVSGARNVCGLAEDIGCREIYFTSSISVYGVHNAPVDEDSIVQPHTPYGQSKVKAEIIHQDWANRTGGRLFILRPGVVFGHGEEGNVSRLMREMLKRQRAIRLLPDQPKAGIYIEELVEIFHWLGKQPLVAGDSQLVNGVSSDYLTFNAYGRALQQLGKLNQSPIIVPGLLLGVSSALMKPLAGLFPTESRFHPQRLRKLVLANDIRPATLIRMNYPFVWPLERALADWLEQGL